MAYKVTKYILIIQKKHHFFTTSRHFSKKIHIKCIFLQKYLVSSKKKQYLCTRFRKGSTYIKTIWCGSSVG